MINDFINIFFPKTCRGCYAPLQRNEAVLCTVCKHQLPLTNFHLYNENTVKKVFYGRIPLNYATSLCYFYKKSLIQRLLHQLKYKGKEEISFFFGNWLAHELSTCSWPAYIDMVIPVPLHKKRLQKRGYNQVEGFGKTLATHLNCIYCDDVLIKKTSSKTQVFKNRFSRSSLNDDFFSLQHTSKIQGKHILLVDDIITTGATLETCASLLLQGKETQLSIATMAFTV